MLSTILADVGLGELWKSLHKSVERQMPVSVVVWPAFNLLTGQNTEIFCQQKEIDNGQFSLNSFLSEIHIVLKLS
jgi:hypothetical protein